MHTLTSAFGSSVGIRSFLSTLESTIYVCNYEQPTKDTRALGTDNLTTCSAVVPSCKEAELVVTYQTCGSRIIWCPHWRFCTSLLHINNGNAKQIKVTSTSSTEDSMDCLPLKLSFLDISCCIWCLMSFACQN